MTPEAEQILFARGVLCLPYMVTNCGGALGGTMEFASVRPERIASFIDLNIGARLAWLIQESTRQKVVPSQIVIPMARRRFAQVRRRAERPAPWQRLFQAGLELYRRGWLPGPLVASLSLGYFKRAMGPDQPG